MQSIVMAHRTFLVLLVYKTGGSSYVKRGHIDVWLKQDYVLKVLSLNFMARLTASTQVNVNPIWIHSHTTTIFPRAF